MHRFPTTEALRLMLAVSAACAVTACASGTQQQVTPPANTGVAQQAAGRLSAANLSERTTSNERRDVDGGDDGSGTAVVYSSLPKVVKAVISQPFEAQQVTEFGDGVNLTRTGKLQRVRYVLSSWGCQTGHWTANNCVTTPGATFPVPITINVYAVSNTPPRRVGALLVTQTKTFNIPFRPSSTPGLCPRQPGDGNVGERFYSAVDHACVHGLANVIVFDFHSPRVNLPLQSIFSLSYNTTDYGPHPIGPTACSSTQAGCGYDSLNVSSDGPGGPIGSPVDRTAAFIGYAAVASGSYCNPLLGGGFRIDSGCPPANDWSQYHPQFEVRVVSGEGEGRDD